MSYCIGHGPPRQARRTQQLSNRVQEAIRLQDLYWSNRKRALQSILEDSAATCRISKQEVLQHFPTFAQERDGEHVWPKIFDQPAPVEDNNSTLMSPFGYRILRKTKVQSDTAPGPDGVRYSQIWKTDRGFLQYGLEAANDSRPLERLHEISHILKRRCEQHWQLEAHRRWLHPPKAVRGLTCGQTEDLGTSQRPIQSFTEGLPGLWGLLRAQLCPSTGHTSGQREEVRTSGRFLRCLLLATFFYHTRLPRAPNTSSLTQRHRAPLHRVQNAHSHDRRTHWQHQHGGWRKTRLSTSPDIFNLTLEVVLTLCQSPWSISISRENEPGHMIRSFDWLYWWIQGLG